MGLGVGRRVLYVILGWKRRRPGRKRHRKLGKQGRGVAQEPADPCAGPRSCQRETGSWHSGAAEV